jgi:hypothetical protein
MLLWRYAGSIPDEMTGFYNRPKSSIRSMALELELKGGLKAICEPNV